MATEKPVGMDSFLPQSYRSKAEAFAKTLQDKLKSLGSCEELHENKVDNNNIKTFHSFDCTADLTRYTELSEILIQNPKIYNRPTDEDTKRPKKHRRFPKRKLMNGQQKSGGFSSDSEDETDVKSRERQKYFSNNLYNQIWLKNDNNRKEENGLRRNETGLKSRQKSLMKGASEDSTNSNSSFCSCEDVIETKPVEEIVEEEEDLNNFKFQVRGSPGIKKYKRLKSRREQESKQVEKPKSPSPSPETEVYFDFDVECFSPQNEPAETQNVDDVLMNNIINYEVPHRILRESSSAGDLESLANKNNRNLTINNNVHTLSSDCIRISASPDSQSLLTPPPSPVSKRNSQDALSMGKSTENIEQGGNGNGNERLPMFDKILPILREVQGCDYNDNESNYIIEITSEDVLQKLNRQNEILEVILNENQNTLESDVLNTALNLANDEEISEPTENIQIVNDETVMHNLTPSEVAVKDVEIETTSGNVLAVGETESDVACDSTFDNVLDHGETESDIACDSKCDNVLAVEETESHMVCDSTCDNVLAVEETELHMVCDSTCDNDLAVEETESYMACDSTSVNEVDFVKELSDSIKLQTEVECDIISNRDLQKAELLIQEDKRGDKVQEGTEVITSYAKPVEIETVKVTETLISDDCRPEETMDQEHQETSERVEGTVTEIPTDFPSCADVADASENALAAENVLEYDIRTSSVQESLITIDVQLSECPCVVVEEDYADNITEKPVNESDALVKKIETEFRTITLSPVNCSDTPTVEIVTWECPQDSDVIGTKSDEPNEIQQTNKPMQTPVVTLTNYGNDLEEDTGHTPRLRRCSSLKSWKTPPGTPGRKKIVRFADALGLDLADVRTFLDEIPKVPTSAFDDLNCETPICREKPKLTTRTLIAMFQQPAGLCDFIRKVQEQNVCLENAVLEDSNLLTISGCIRVRNVGYNKDVHVRYSIDNWSSYSDLQATYVPNSCDGFSDKFTFTLYGHTLKIGDKIEFAIKYQTCDQQFWDSNGGLNYSFQCLPHTTTTSFDDTSQPWFY